MKDQQATQQDTQQVPTRARTRTKRRVKPEKAAPPSAADGLPVLVPMPNASLKTVAQALDASFMPGASPAGGARMSTELRVNTDPTIPKVILIAPPNAGKTVLSLRLAQYFMDIGGAVAPNFEFREKDDYYQKTLCPAIAKWLAENRQRICHRPPSTPGNDALCLDFKRDDRTIFQLIEASGEDYFVPTQETQITRTHTLQLLNGPGRKVLVFVLPLPKQDDPGALSATDFSRWIAYVESMLKKHFHPKKDNVLVVISKANQRGDLLRDPNRPDVRAFRRALFARGEVSRIEEFLRKKGADLNIVPFAAVEESSEQGSNTMVFVDDAWPRKLLGEIEQAVLGPSLLQRVMRWAGF